MIKIHLKCDPPTATAQQKGVRIVTPRQGRPFASFYKKETLKDAEKLFKGLLAKFIPGHPLTGPLKVECEWIFPWRASEKKSVVREFVKVPKDTKPDADNSNKLLLDCMTDLGFWEDDSQVYNPDVSKFWGDEPGITIIILHGEEIPTWKRNFEMFPESGNIEEIASLKEMNRKLKEELSEALASKR